MVDMVKTRDELLTIFEDGQTAGSISPQDVRDFVVSAVVFDTAKVIKIQADFPDPIEAPDGVMRIPLDISVDYIFDVDQINIDTPFLMPPRLLGYERVRFRSITNTTFFYSGTESLFWGRNQGPFETDKLDYIGEFVNNPVCFDMIAAEGIVPLTIYNTVFDTIEMGYVEGFAMTGFRVSFFNLLGPFRLHNISRCFYNILILDTPAPTPAFPVAFIITGGEATSGYGFDNVIAGLIGVEQSYFVVDSGATFNQTIFRDIPFDDSAGATFFELDLTGSILSFTDLDGLITGIPTFFENDGSDNVLVTDAGHDVYAGLTLNFSGTTDYDGDRIVTRIVGNNQYVIDATYFDDKTSGSYVGVGTRVTTDAPHGITAYRTTIISDTTNYNNGGLRLDVLNPTVSTFDIVTPFSVDEIGIYSTTSLNQTDVRVVSENNGTLPNSQKTGEVDLSIPITVANSNAGFEKIGGMDWVVGSMEEFLGNSNGELTYIGVNSTLFTVIGTATIEETGGGQNADLLAMRIAKDDVTIASSQGSTQNNTLTQVTCIAVVELVKNEKISLYVADLDSGNTVNVNLATLLVSGR